MRHFTRKQKLLFVVIGIFCFVSMSGCSMKFGNIAEKSHFAIPNSNVRPLGQVSVEKTKSSFIIPPSIDASDVRALLNAALQQKAGADMIINYSVDTKVTVIPIPIFSYYIVTMSLSGTAASMEVGEKGLQETIKNVGY